MEAIGISFPFRISPTTGGVQSAKFNDQGEITLIRQSVLQILWTRLGERTIEKNFGTELLSLVFEPLDDSLQQAVQYTVVKALSTWEPRIVVNKLEFFVSQDDGQLVMRLYYSVLRTNVPDQLDIPITR
jgi:uncharacterized protein